MNIFVRKISGAISRGYYVYDKLPLKNGELSDDKCDRGLVQCFGKSTSYILENPRSVDHFGT
jgi:hypothetical protein